MNREDRFLFLNTLALRIIGYVTMILDHVGIFLLNYAYALPDPSAAEATANIFRIVGRIAFPIFVFLLAEGMNHTRSKEKYILRIGIMYLLLLAAQLVLIYGFNEYALEGVASPFTDLLLCALVLYCLSKPKFWKLFALLPGAILILAFVITAYEGYASVTIHWWPYAYRPAYSILGMLSAIGFYYAPKIAVKTFHNINQEQGISDEIYLETGFGRRSANMIGCIFFFITVLGLWGLSYLNGRTIDPLEMSQQSWCLIAILPLFLYNGRKGPGGLALKIFNYAFFPVHIVIIFLIFQAIMG